MAVTALFNDFDEDGSGRITLRNMRRIARELGENLSDDELHLLARNCAVLRFRVGEKLECRMEAQGYEKSWYKAEILQIKEDGSIKVRWGYIGAALDQNCYGAVDNGGPAAFAACPCALPYPPLMDLAQT